MSDQRPPGSIPPDIKLAQAIERNYSGNDGELLLSRLHNPEIKRQVCKLLFALGDLYADDPDKIDEDIQVMGLTDDQVLKSRHYNENLYDSRLEGITKVTPINFSDDADELSTSDAMILSPYNPLTNKPWTTKEMSIIEAHEKGHVIRDYMTGPYKEYFRQGFDLSKVVIPEEDLAGYRDYAKDTLHLTDPEEIERAAADLQIKYLFSGHEIAERMNQLKNYFGFKGTERFTKQHLDIAREHYVADTGMDNDMTVFFMAITPETEGKFLEIINNAGI